MKNKKIILIFIVAIVLSFAAILSYKIYFREMLKPRSIPISSEDAGAAMNKMREESYRKKAYAPLVAVYEKMLVNMPESIELKKKLAFAYFAATQYEKARPLLEEVSKTNSADDEVKRELEFIDALQRK